MKCTHGVGGQVEVVKECGYEITCTQFGSCATAMADEKAISTDKLGAITGELDSACVVCGASVTAVRKDTTIDGVVMHDVAARLPARVAGHGRQAGRE